MEHPRFSLIVPVFDPPVAALSAAIASVAAQTFPDFECVLVDDASTDPAVVAELDRHVMADGRFRLVRRSVNGGIAAATNDGLDAAAGVLVVFCDHDDLLAPAALAAIDRHLRRHPDDDVVYTDEQLIDEQGETLHEYRKPAWSPERMLGHNYFNHLVAIRRSTIGDTRVRAAYEPAQDWDFLLRVIPHARSVGHIPEMLYSWRAISGSTALDAAEKPEVFEAIRRTAQDALTRAGEPGTVEVVRLADGTPATGVRIGRPHDPSTVAEFIEFDDSTTAADVVAALTSSTADVVTLLHRDCRLPERDHHILVAEAVRPAIGAAGPTIVSTDGRFVSVGRSMWPTFHDPHRGLGSDNAGEWGAFLVAREVSALAPNGFTVERARVEACGGLRTDVSLDAALAELCTRLRLDGTPVLWTPAARLVHDDAAELDPVAAERDLATIAARLPEVDDERYVTSGRGAVATIGATPRQQIERAIRLGTVDVVTSDVFDTLVTRPAATPSDVFVTLAKRLRADGRLDREVPDALFAGGRRHAERRARDAVRERRAGAPAPECTITEIWERMPDGWFPAGVSTADLIEAELDVEAELLRPIGPTVDLLADAHRAGLRIVLVSDTYLSSDLLRQLLERAGLDLSVVDRVVTSSDDRLGKADGLLERVVAEETDEPSRVIHLGDNELSDVEAARRAGAQAVATDLTGTIRSIPATSRALLDYSRRTGTDGGVSAAARSALIGSELQIDPAYQFGASVAGPAIAGFARWASTTAAEEGADALHCLHREGARIAEFIEVLDPHRVRTVGVHASRWVVARAAVVHGDADEISVALARRRTFDVDHVVDAFGCDRQRLVELIGAGPFDLHDTVRAYEALAEDDLLRAQIVASAADLRRRLVRYLDTAIGLDGDGPIVMCDIGWGGTIQQGLTTVLRDAGVERPVIGLYLALSEPGEHRLAAGADMRSYLPNGLDGLGGDAAGRVIAHNADIAERLLTPRMGTLVDVDTTGAPVCLDADHDRIPPSLVAAQAGVRAFAESLARIDRSRGWADDEVWVRDGAFRSALARRFADGVLTPTPEVAAALGTWPHDDVAGTHARAIAPDHVAEMVGYLGAASLDRVTAAETAWPEGLAAQVNPPLSAQIRAVADGLDGTDLCALSDVGMARLAVFAQDSHLATAQDARVPSLSPAGWSVLRVETPIASLRSLRFDAGDAALLCELGMLTLRLHLDDGSVVERRVDDLTDGALVWVDAHPLDDRHFVARAGGHLLVGLDDDTGARVRRVAVDVAFRAWPVDEDSPLAAEPLRQRVVAQQRRITGAARRAADRLRSRQRGTQPQDTRPSGSTS